MRTKSIVSLVFLLTAIAAPSMAKEAEYSEEKLPFGYVRSMDAAVSGAHPTADALLLAAEMENRYGHHDKAIAMCVKALEMDPEDMDIHKAYAESLEKKLRKQKEKDGNLFLAAVAEWLIVLRGERGEERGMVNSKGLGIPFMPHLYRDEERAIPAREHLVSLVGRAPGNFESDQKYLQRASDAALKQVRARILKKQAEADGSTPDAKDQDLDKKPGVADTPSKKRKTADRTDPDNM